MGRFYRSPCLLIEFSADRAFLLQTSADIRDSVEASNICSKLALLCIAFPGLRLLWWVGSAPRQCTAFSCCCCCCC